MNATGAFASGAVKGLRAGFLVLLLNSPVARAPAQEPRPEAASLVRAIEGDDTNTVQRLLLADTNLTRALYHGRLPLHVAASKGRLGLVELLLKSGADINAEGDTLETSNKRITPLHAAIWYNHPAVVKRLLEAGADPNHLNPWDGSALHVAFTYKRDEMAGWLLDHGANPFLVGGTPFQKTVPFAMAITRSDGKLIPRMLRESRVATVTSKRGGELLAGGDLAPLNPPAAQFLRTNGTAMLAAAAQRGELEAVEALLQAGLSAKDIGASRHTLMQSFTLSAATSSRLPGFSAERWLRIRDLLQKHGGEYDVFAATGLGDLEVAERLWTADKNLIQARDYLGDTPLHWAVQADRLPLTSFWLEAGALPTATNLSGQTALHLAAARGLTEHVKRLLAAQSPTEARDTNGWTPLEAAMQAKQTETIRLLLAGSSGRPPPGRGIGKTLHEAAANGNIVALTEFATRQNLEARNELGFTPLHLAAQRGQLGAAAFLLDKGAEVNALDADGNTVLHLVLLSPTHWVAGLPSDAWVERKRQDPQKEKFWRVFTATNEFQSAKQVAASVAFFLACGADAKIKNKAGKTVLQIVMDEQTMLFEEDRAALLPLFSQNGGGLDARDEKGETALHRAAREILGDNAAALIAAGADVNATNRQGRTPLHVAVEELGGWGDSEPINLILKAKPNVNAQDNAGLAPLHVLLLSDSIFHKEATEALLAAGADPNLRDKHGRTPLLACLSGEWPWRAASDSLRQLVAAGAKADVTDNQGRTPLHYLAAMGQQDPMFFIRELTNAFASPNMNFNATDSAGDTPLHLAARSGAVAVFDWLRTRGARLDVTNAAGQTPRVLAQQHQGPFPRFNLGPTTDVAAAARRGEVEALRRSFAAERREVNATNQTGETALRIAARHGQTNAAKELIKLGAEWDAVSATLLGRTDVLTDILARRPAEATNFTDGKALLHLAAESGNVAVVEVLLSAGADLNARARSGLSPLGLALMKKQSEAADVLRARGAAENIFDTVYLDLPEKAAAVLERDKSLGQLANAVGLTPLHLAAALDRAQVLKVLVEHRVPVDLAAGPGQLAPLHVAAACNRTNTAALLLKHRAKPEVGDRAGFTPLHYAAACGAAEVAAMLLKQGAKPDTTIKLLPSEGPYPVTSGILADSTALHLAVLTGQTNVIALLVKARASVNATNAHGQTPLDLLRGSTPRVGPLAGYGPIGMHLSPLSLPGAKLHFDLRSVGITDLTNPVSPFPMWRHNQATAELLERAGAKTGNPPRPGWPP